MATYKKYTLVVGDKEAKKEVDKMPKSMLEEAALRLIGKQKEEIEKLKENVKMYQEIVTYRDDEIKDLIDQIEAMDAEIEELRSFKDFVYDWMANDEELPEDFDLTNNL